MEFLAWISIAQSVYELAFRLLTNRCLETSSLKSSTQQRKTTCLLLDSNIAYLRQNIEINNNKHVYRHSQVQNPNCSEVKWAECSLIIGTDCCSLGLWECIQSPGEEMSWDFQVRIQHSTEEDILSPLDSNIAYLCQTIEINNNKHVYCQSKVQKPNCSKGKWAECSLIIGTGCWVQVLSLILNRSVGLWVGIQSAGE